MDEKNIDAVADEQEKQPAPSEQEQFTAPVVDPPSVETEATESSVEVEAEADVTRESADATSADTAAPSEGFAVAEEANSTDASVIPTEVDEPVTTEDATVTNRIAESASALEQFVETSAPMAGDSNLLAAAQSNLYKHIKALEDDLELELKVQSNALSTESKHREKIGVELYNLQHQLARFQTNFETMQKTVEDTRKLRVDKETARESIDKSCQAVTRKMADADRNLIQQKLELNKVYHTLRQLQLHDATLNATLATTKRSVSKTSTDLTAQEIQKQKQDFYLDSLVTELAQIEEQIAIYEYRIGIQRGDLKGITDALADAATEMEAITFEKQQLLKHWKMGLLALERRDQLLNSIHEAVSKENDAGLSLKSELSALKDVLRAAFNQTEELQVKIAKLENDTRYTDQQLAKLVHRTEVKQQAYTLCSKTIEQTERHAKTVANAHRSLEREVLHKEQEFQRVRMAVHQAEQALLQEVQRHTSLQKQVGGTKNDGAKVKSAIFQKEAIISKLCNEIAHRELEMVNFENKKNDTNARARDIDAQIDAENLHIESLDKELRKQYEEIGRKQSEMEALTRKHNAILAQLSKNATDYQGEMGPLEIALHASGKVIKDMETKSLELQQSWLRTQNELVGVGNQIETLESALADAQMRNAVLLRSRSTVDEKIRDEEEEVKFVERMMLQLKSDMAKVNRLLQQHDLSEARFSTLNMESELRARLRISQLTKVRLEESLREVAQEKERIANELMLSEKEIAVWMRRLDLAKQAKEAAHPRAEEDDIGLKLKVIDRMKQHHAMLLKRQQHLLQEMDHSIRRHIDISALALKMEGGVQDNSAKRALKRTIIDLTRQIKAMEQSIDQITAQKKYFNDYRAELTATLHRFVSQQEAATTDLARVFAEYDAKQMAKSRGVITVAESQARLKRWEEVKRDGGDKKVAAMDVTALEQIKSKHTGRWQQLQQIRDELAQKHLSSGQVTEARWPLVALSQV